MSGTEFSACAGMPMMGSEVGVDYSQTFTDSTETEVIPAAHKRRLGAQIINCSSVTINVRPEWTSVSYPLASGGTYTLENPCGSGAIYVTAASGVAVQAWQFLR